jgi:hypothetical protein
LFKDAWFAKFAEKEGIGDKELKAAVEGIKHGGVTAAWAAAFSSGALRERGLASRAGYRSVFQV